MPAWNNENNDDGGDYDDVDDNDDNDDNDDGDNVDDNDDVDEGRPVVPSRSCRRNRRCSSPGRSPIFSEPEAFFLHLKSVFENDTYFCERHQDNSHYCERYQDHSHC